MPILHAVEGCIHFHVMIMLVSLLQEFGSEHRQNNAKDQVKFSGHQRVDSAAWHGKPCTPLASSNLSSNATLMHHCTHTSASPRSREAVRSRSNASGLREKLRLGDEPRVPGLATVVPAFC